MLFIGSHPDDIELGCLGSMLHYSKYDKANVYCIIASDGEEGCAGSNKYNRMDESIKCLTGAGVKKSRIKFLHLPDRQLELHSLRIIEEVEKSCKENDINWVLLQTNQDTHQDHRSVYSAVMSAARNIDNVLIYESNSSTATSFSPNYFVDISPYIKEKMDLLAHHKSQADRQYMKVDSVLGLARYRGSQSKKASYAEAFEVFRITESAPTPKESKTNVKNRSLAFAPPSAH